MSSNKEAAEVKEVQANFRRLRKSRGLTLAMAAEREFGGPDQRGRISSLERSGDPRISTLIRLARSYGVSLEALFKHCA